MLPTSIILLRAEGSLETMGFKRRFCLLFPLMGKVGPRRAPPRPETRNYPRPRRRRALALVSAELTLTPGGRLLASVDVKQSPPLPRPGDAARFPARAGRDARPYGTGAGAFASGGGTEHTLCTGNKPMSGRAQRPSPTKGGGAALAMGEQRGPPLRNWRGCVCFGRRRGTIPLPTVVSAAARSFHARPAGHSCSPSAQPPLAPVGRNSRGPSSNSAH